MALAAQALGNIASFLGDLKVNWLFENILYTYQTLYFNLIPDCHDSCIFAYGPSRRLVGCSDNT